MNTKLFLRLLLAAVFASGPALAGLPEGTDLETATWVGGHKVYGGNTISSGSPFWAATSESLDGTDAVVGRVELNGTIASSSWLGTTLTGPATLYFSWRVTSSQGSYGDIGSFSVSIDGITSLPVLAPDILGSGPIDTGWREGSVPLPTGDHTVLWTLGGWRSGPNTKAYLDQVWTSNDPRPRLTASSIQSASVGTPFSLDAGVTGGPDLVVSTANLPSGLTLNPSTHVISGIPTTAGTFEATLAATNTHGVHKQKMRFQITPGSTTMEAAVDAPSLTFTQPSGRKYAWSAVTGLGQDGIDCARFAAPLETMSTLVAPYVLSTQVTGPGTMYFWWNSTTCTMDYMTLGCWLTTPSLGSSPVVAYPYGSTGWLRASVSVPDGPQTVSWGARRTGANPCPAYSDPLLYAYLDQVIWIPTVPSPQPTFAAWATAWKVDGQPATADLDGDGLPLLLEYAFGGSPYTSDKGFQPVITFSAGFVWINVTKGSGPTDLSYVVQATSELSSNAWSANQVEIVEEDASHVLARVPVSGGPRFLRVKLLLTP